MMLQALYVLQSGRAWFQQTDGAKQLDSPRPLLYCLVSVPCQVTCSGALKVMNTPSTVSGSGSPNTGKPRRIESVDLLRGVVMVLMALDHVRDFFHADALVYDPLDLSRTSPELFFTRWITHFCAPVFVFLAGTGAFLSTVRGKSRKQLSRFLLTRGLFLVVAELTLVRFGWMFNFDTNFLFVQVIWAIGCSMVALSGLVYLTMPVIAVISLGMIGLHNLFDGISAESLPSIGWLWSILHSGEVIDLGGGRQFYPLYPLIPWIGVMGAGYVFGAFFRWEETRRRNAFTWIGVGLIGAFVLLRITNLYGDAQQWDAQTNGLNTFLSFLNTTKYPPSLLFLLMTLGPAILALAFFERWENRVSRFIVVFGRVPMMYYLIHIYFIHALSVIVGVVQGYPLSSLLNLGMMYPEGYGYSLAVTYFVWVVVIVLLYPVCRWYADLKKRRNDFWLSYL